MLHPVTHYERPVTGGKAIEGHADPQHHASHSTGRRSGSFAFVSDKQVLHKPAPALLGEYESGMNPSDRDDASVCKALTLPFVVLMNDRDVRTDEPDLGHFLAH
jgi:hypothetical protein